MPTIDHIPMLLEQNTITYLGPRVLLAEQVGVEVGHLPVPLVCKAPHQLPVAHVVELLPLLLGLTALLEPVNSLIQNKHMRRRSSIKLGHLP